MSSLRSRHTIPVDEGESLARLHAAIQIQSQLSPEWLADRIVVITQLAETLDRGTLELALRIVPVKWWEGRLATR